MDIVILLYKGFTALDVVGPYEVLSRLPNAVVKFVAKQKGIIESEYSSMKMVATHTLEEIENADILMIPGSTTAFLNVVKDAETLHHVQRIDATTQWTISVCSGAVLLAAAGLLKGKAATTHWGLLDMLSKFGANPVAERYIQHGKIITAAGVSAGIDMALYLTKAVAGEAYAKMVQLIIEYYPEPPINISDFSAVPKEVEEAARAFFKKEMMKMNIAAAAMN
ncbi:DJ-1/PfpI family protein [Ilyomonas limi]|uniref:DJ-1/PfpI family protein n=1 Tax=Ilyomonas limi TaxID=2575867 RepID=A0A4U3LB74_9BACT|nr:DJ-1/PfpI family protein [Ilyomonas limi]TKK71999.1 DJ-1/PfpI family protein [Ilyomonas limi]